MLTKSLTRSSELTPPGNLIENDKNQKITEKRMRLNNKIALVTAAARVWGAPEFSFCKKKELRSLLSMLIKTNLLKWYRASRSWFLCDWIRADLTDDQSARES
ncbi:MAG: hypothetical protein CM1200mP41_11960 [Gammaproteobacteria bacterium]|nr:MAG: hypothetical protein CM1200mP41_11960 [Gammaproteobacteria bacterium]